MPNKRPTLSRDLLLALQLKGTMHTDTELKDIEFKSKMGIWRKYTLAVSLLGHLHKDCRAACVCSRKMLQLIINMKDWFLSCGMDKS